MKMALNLILNAADLSLEQLQARQEKLSLDSEWVEGTVAQSLPAQSDVAALPYEVGIRIDGEQGSINEIHSTAMEFDSNDAQRVNQLTIEQIAQGDAWLKQAALDLLASSGFTPTIQELVSLGLACQESER
jgi:hypothetical protein